MHRLWANSVPFCIRNLNILTFVSKGEPGTNPLDIFRAAACEATQRWRTLWCLWVLCHCGRAIAFQQDKWWRTCKAHPFILSDCGNGHKGQNHRFCFRLWLAEPPGHFWGLYIYSGPGSTPGTWWKASLDVVGICFYTQINGRVSCWWVCVHSLIEGYG